MGNPKLSTHYNVEPWFFTLVIIYPQFSPLSRLDNILLYVASLREDQNSEYSFSDCILLLHHNKSV